MEVKGKVIKAFGNLVHVEFEDVIRQGAVCSIKLDDFSLLAEVIEIKGNEAKVQVFEDTDGIKFGAPVEFHDYLLEAELGPGLLTSIFDGLQNPLIKVSKKAGVFLNRGITLPSLDRSAKWRFYPSCNVKDVLRRGDFLGKVKEGRFDHHIMVPFSLMEEVEIEWIADEGEYNIEEVIAKGRTESDEIVDFCMLQKWPVKKPLMEGERVRPKNIMDTGLRVIDTMFPLLKGSTFCVPGPFGAGKTVLQHHLAKFSSVDIVIIAACGERAGEVVEVLRDFPHLIDENTKEPLLNRTVIICNTSSMPVSAREASVYMAVTIAEYYRQMGLHVLVLADSTSRWAQAMREISGRLEELPGEEAFPAYLSSRIAAFYERAGLIKLSNNALGSLTIGGTVSPAGGNFEEPVTQATLSIVGAFLGLSRERSNSRKYPAIDPLISWTKYLHKVSEHISSRSKNWENKIKHVVTILRKGDEIAKRMEVIGEEGTIVDDMVIFLLCELFDYCYLQQNAFDKEDAYCSLERQIEVFEFFYDAFNSTFVFDNNEEARTFFLKLQSELKNINYLAFRSVEYQKKMEQVKHMIKERQT